MKNKEKQLPKIMYDQTQYMPLYWLDKNGIYLSDASYFGSMKLSGYAPERWYIYTQNKPESFFFGAYPQESLDEEARVGFNNFTNPKFLNKFEQATFLAYKKTRKIGRIYFKNFYKREENALTKRPKEVVNLLQEIRNVNKFIMSYYLLTQPQRFYKFEEELKKFLPNKDLELISTNGRHLTFVSKIHRAIIDFAKKLYDSKLSFDEYANKYPDEYKRLETTIKKIGFLNWGFLGGDLIDKDYARKQIEDIVSDSQKFHREIKKMDKLISAIEKRNEILKKDTSPQARLADIMGHSSILRFDLQTCVLCILKYADNFVKIAKEKHGLSNEDISSYFCDEILDLIRNGKKVDDEILQKRQKGFLRIHTQKEIKTYVAEEAHVQIKELLEFRENEIKNIKEVTGTIASWPDKNQDKITGRAFVLTTAFGAEEKLKNFNKGDILITTQTHPNLVPHMKIATAIVTDEGGITCHAAIVSRELDKPCIVGTKLASKIFKTGDNIELDLKNGRVKKIN